MPAYVSLPEAAAFKMDRKDEAGEREEGERSAQGTVEREKGLERQAEDTGSCIWILINYFPLSLEPNLICKDHHFYFILSITQIQHYPKSNSVVFLSMTPSYT